MASHTGIIYIIYTMLINKPDKQTSSCSLTGVTPDKISVQHKPTVAAKQKRDC